MANVGDMVYLVTSYGRHSGDIENLRIYESLVEAQAFKDTLQEQVGIDNCIISVDSFTLE